VRFWRLLFLALKNTAGMANAMPAVKVSITVSTAPALGGPFFAF